MRNQRLISTIIPILLLCASPARAEIVDVKYRGRVDLASFACTDVIRSSFIRRVCFDTAKSYMVISLNGTYYHYCSIPASTVDALLGADSMGRFFNAQVKGQYDCRLASISGSPSVQLHIALSLHERREPSKICVRPEPARDEGFARAFPKGIWITTRNSVMQIAQGCNVGRHDADPTPSRSPVSSCTSR